jgi:hypothetical protein
MKIRTKRMRIVGVTTGLMGVGVLAVNAVAYVLKREQSNAGLAIVGIMLAVVGAGMVRRGRAGS